MVQMNRRRSSTSSQNSTSSQSTSASPPTYISLDPRIISPKPRRIAVTPPSVLPPSVSVTGSSIQQYERDRCKSPNLQAKALLAKVAAPFGSVPTSPLSSSGTSSASSSPGEGANFNFFSKSLLDSPESGYISFPQFEESVKEGEVQGR